MLVLKNISYQHNNNDLLFSQVNFTINRYQKIALIGRNGSGKSTLLKIIAGVINGYDGQLSIAQKPYYVPQIYGQYNQLTVAQALGIDQKLFALKNILRGELTTENYTLLDDDWTVEERAILTLEDWHLKNLPLHQSLSNLSGGEKTKVFLAGISLHKPDLVLLDEPSNHLDTAARKLLYHFIQQSSSTILAVSHDVQLLNLMNATIQLTSQGVKVYGGNYNFYLTQKEIEDQAYYSNLSAQEKLLRKATMVKQETLERKLKQDSKGKSKHQKAGVPKVMMDKMKNDAEKSTSKIKQVHVEKISAIKTTIETLRTVAPITDKIKLNLGSGIIHKKKVLFSAMDINHNFNHYQIFANNLTFDVVSGERIAITGSNGSGKTTLIKIILGLIKPNKGKVKQSSFNALYIDQDYAMINNELNVYHQALLFNSHHLQEHEIKTRLNRFLFHENDWNKSCLTLSGGEKMRLLLCCLNINNQTPDIIILDEPTNNIDIDHTNVLKQVVNDYNGTLIIVSHDEYFLSQLNIERSIIL
ncbi:MAG: ABC-F family ATP-binding cassette domain-containing protein [Bacteroidia bacterium]